MSQGLSGCFLGRSFITAHSVKSPSHFAEKLTREGEGEEGGEKPCLYGLSFPCSLNGSGGVESQG